MLTKAEITEHLESKGFKHAHAGFRYLVEMIEYCDQNEASILKFMSAYKATGKIHNTTPECVERCVRHARIAAGYNDVPNKEIVFEAVDTIRARKEAEALNG